jgi:hypothetical protein
MEDFDFTYPSLKSDLHTQSVVSTHLSDAPIEVADCPVDFDFTYPSLKSNLF